MTPLLDRRQPDDVVFAALSAGPRRAIMVALREGRMSRAEIEDLLPDLSHEAVGRHLNALVGAGLAVRSGRTRGEYRRDTGALTRALTRLHVHGGRGRGSSPVRRNAI